MEHKINIERNSVRHQSNCSHKQHGFSACLIKIICVVMIMVREKTLTLIIISITFTLNKGMSSERLKI
jgi:hypothetical protein